MKVFTKSSTIEVVDDGISPIDVARKVVRQIDNEEPFYVADLSEIIRKHEIWKTKLPRVKPFYAVSCNDTTVVLEILSSLGASFSCFSKPEIQKLLEIGVDKSRIIYSNPYKSISYLKYAASQKISPIVFDNEQELIKIKETYPEAKLVLRIRCDDNPSNRFGADEKEAAHLLQVAREQRLTVIGLSFHVGFGYKDSSIYHRDIKKCRTIFNLSEKIGCKLELLDIGGGFPGQDGSSITFDEVASVVSKSLDQFFPDEEVKIIAEPGQYFVSSAFILCANVIAKRIDYNSIPGENLNMYYLSEGVYGTFHYLRYNYKEPIPKLLTESKLNESVRCSIWGPTCEGGDRIVKDMILPSMEIGDWVVFHNMGAYTVVQASTFNGFKKAQIHPIIPESTWTHLQQKINFCDSISSSKLSWNKYV